MKIKEEKKKDAFCFCCFTNICATKKIFANHLVNCELNSVKTNESFTFDAFCFITLGAGRRRLSSTTFTVYSATFFDFFATASTCTCCRITIPLEPPSSYVLGSAGILVARNKSLRCIQATGQCCSSQCCSVLLDYCVEWRVVLRFFILGAGRVLVTYAIKVTRPRLIHSNCWSPFLATNKGYSFQFLFC